MADLPSRDDILKFIADQPGKVGKREIARAFRVSASERIALKKLLREMTAEGLLEGARKSGMRVQGDLPNVCVIRVTGRDSENNLVARAVREGDVLDGEDAAEITIIEPGGRGRVNRSAQLVSPGDTALARLARLAKNRYEARIIRKLGGSLGTVIGVIRHRPDGPWVVPVNRQERYEFRAREGAEGLEEDTLVKAEKISAGRTGTRSGVGSVKIIETFGSANAPHAYSIIAIAEQGLPTDFPDDVLTQADKADPNDIDANARTDLRDIAFVTIDPADARDHDDAVFAEPDPAPDNAGGHIVWVAIADVAVYVRPDSPMDKEARKRGNSVYMPDRVVPMLPERLSTDLCSLREHEERPCMAVRMQFDAYGKKLGHKFVRGTMRSAAKLSYQEAQRVFDSTPESLPEDAPGKALAENVLHPLWDAYQAMAQARETRAPLIIDKPERRIEMDDKGRITRIYVPARLEAHKLIEEMMIAANVCAAETLEQRQTPLLFRVHDAPPPDRVHALADFIRPLGARIDLGQPVVPALFNRLMVKAREGEHYPTISEAVLRTQSQAIYTPENIGHFGLNLGRYAHFTSPIRRYADLIVHRALIRALKLGNDGLTDSEIEKLPTVAEAVSVTERRAMIAERTAADRYLSAYMSDRIGDRFAGQISGVSRAGLFIKLNETGADGLVPISRLGAERFFVDDDKLSLVGGTTGTVFRIGQPVEVSLVEATPLQGGLLFSLEDYASFPSVKGRRVRRGPKTSRRPTGRKARPMGRRRTK